MIRLKNLKMAHRIMISFLILFMTVVMLFVGGLASGTCNAAGNPQKLRVGSELEFPPYAFVDEKGRPTGFSVELIKAVTDTMGLSVKISTGSWDTIWNSLVSGQLDVLPIVAKLPERQRLVDFSLPHTETYDAFFVRKGDSPIPSIAAARGKETVVMRSDAAHHALLERNFQGKLILVDTIPAGLKLISSGKHNAFLCSKLIGTLSIKEHGIAGLAAGPPIPDYKRVFSFAVKKGDTELLEKLNQGLLIVKTNGEYDRIYDKWLSFDDPWRKVQKYLLPAIITVIAIAVIAGFWLVTLQRLVKKRTRELAEKNKMLRHAFDNMEARVQERTAELARANQLLQADITDRKQVENELRESEEKFRTIFDRASDGILIADAITKKFLQGNATICSMLGYTKEEIESLTFYDIHPPKDISHVLDEFEKQVKGEKVLAEDLPVLRKDGSIFYADIGSTPTTIRGIHYLVGIFHDITERKQAEWKLKASLREKETMFKEIHHRVKNNLQVISSLLNMQSSYLQDKKAREALWESMARVRTMAMIHTQLYQSTDLTGVDFGLFIRDLIGNISQSYGMAASPVEINVDANNISLGIDTSIPCGLILNELISNALKHAFPEGKEGEINIRMRSEDSRVVLTVRDNGIGFPESIDLTNVKSLGLELVNILVGQMNGKIDMQVDGGTTWTITLPVKNERGWQNG